MIKSLDKGWNFNYELIWDCVTSWYSDNRPLARHKGIFIFGDDKSWNFDDAIIVDGKKRKISKGNNGRGNYECHPLDGATHLSTIYSFSNTQLNDEHGYGKPIKWIAAIINGVNANLIFDMFAGSGNVLFACEQLNKICYAMDINGDYISAIINKWEKITGEKAKKII
jgi:DNA modification methylase